ncbi:hypothetical protein [Moraxella caviae]|uniref:hypothetical protein n=1 Tax=Moraxella caviae TaxID=34060 RepID=UPI0011C02B90|nr:hypothetical protein [Moraxella caviae]
MTVMSEIHQNGQPFTQNRRAKTSNSWHYSTSCAICRYSANPKNHETCPSNACDIPKSHI